MQNNSQMSEVTAENIKDFIAAMENHRTTCEKDGRYKEAEQAKARLKDLKEQEFTMEY